MGERDTLSIATNDGLPYVEPRGCSACDRKQRRVGLSEECGAFRGEAVRGTKWMDIIAGICCRHVAQSSDTSA